MKLGRLPRGLGAAFVAALVSVPLAPSVASAAPAAPAAYTVVTRAYPLYWAGSGGLSVNDLRVPHVFGQTNNLPLVESKAALMQPDLAAVSTISGEAAAGLSCTGFDERKCRDPFLAQAVANHNVVEGARTEQAASFTGKDGNYPGRIRALTDCGGDCGKQLVRTVGEAAGPAGGLAGYISIGSSSAGQDVSIDDHGRLVGSARSELRDVVIGPNGEVRIGSLLATASAVGAGAANSKDGHADIRLSGFQILDNPVELTRSGLRLASDGRSEQEAYDGGKALLEELKSRGITLELPDFGAQVDRQPGHVTVQAAGLRVRFDRSVQGPPGVRAGTVDQVLDLGSSTALVAAYDENRQIDVSFDGDKAVVTPSPAETAAPPPSAPAGDKPEAARPGPGRDNPAPTAPRPNRSVTGKIGVDAGPPATNAPAPDVTAPAPPELLPPPEAAPVPQTPGNTDEVADFPDDVARTLGLRGARSVSQAFGAFLGLGLILPLARFVIKRLG